MVKRSSKDRLEPNRQSCASFYDKLYRRSTIIGAAILTHTLVVILFQYLSVFILREEPIPANVPIGQYYFDGVPKSGIVKKGDMPSDNLDDKWSDTRLKALNSELALAKAYLEFGPIKKKSKFSKELQNLVMDIQIIISNAHTDFELPKDANSKQVLLNRTLAKGKIIIDDCVGTEKNFHKIKRQFNAERKSKEFVNQLLSKTIPRNLHCLSMKLSNDYYSSKFMQNVQFPNKEKLEDPNLHHYVLFTDCVLAAAVTVNSTLYNSKHPGNVVFHIITDELSFAAMRMWFLINPLGEATIQIQKIEEFTWLNSSYSPVLKQLESKATIDYYFNTRGVKPDKKLKFRNPKYISILNHLRFYLPQIFPKLKRVVFLDDDIVVQRDLSGLWDIDLKGNVNGAVETCVGEKFHRFKDYLNFSQPLIANNFDPDACGWAYGMNIFDLVEWKKQNITDIYHYWQRLHNLESPLWKLGSLPPGLITFYNLTLPIDHNWHILGLGYKEEKLEQKDIENAAVLHYNGNKKPWLDTAIAKYYSYWCKYLDFDQMYLRSCKILP